MGIFAIVEVVDKETGKVTGKMISNTITVDTIHQDYMHEDGFLYISLKTENVFG